MRRSAAPSAAKNSKKARFVVPYANNAQFASNSNRTSLSNNAPMQFGFGKQQNISSTKANLEVRNEYSPILSEPKCETKNYERSTQDILKLLDSNDSDSETAVSFDSDLQHETQDYSEPTYSKEEIDSNSNTVLKADNSDDNIDVLSTSLTADSIYNMNSSKNELRPCSESRYFSVMYAKRSMKKHKKWEGDGVLIVKSRTAILKDLEGKEVARGIGYKVKEVSEIEDGKMFFIGGKECEIQYQISQKEFASGKCFQTLTESEIPTVSVIKKFQPPSNVPLPKKQLSSEIKPITDENALFMPRPNIFHKVRNEQIQIVDVTVDTFLKKNLRPHQIEGIKFMYECILGFRNFNGFGAILGDEMGLGKTLQCITLIWTLVKKGPFGGKPVLKKVLIITPSSLVKNWSKEFFKWLGKDRLPIFAVGPDRKVKDFINSRYTVLIISYEMYVRSAEILSSVNFDLVICDEGHRLKNLNIRTAEVITSLPTKRRIILTGTPIQNDLQEFYAIVEFVNPGILGTQSAFRKVYDEPILTSRNPDCTDEEKVLGEERASRLSSICSLFFLRRTQEVINKFLPPKYEFVVFCKLTNLQCDLYDHLLDSRAVRSFMASEGFGNSSSPLACISILRKLCNHPSLLYSGQKDEDEEFVSDGSILTHMNSAFLHNYEYQTYHAGKMIVLEKLLESLFSSTLKEKIVLVSGFTQTLNILEKLCKSKDYSYLRLDGSTNTASRLDLVEQFNASYSKYIVFLLSSKAGGVGLNLIGASRILLYDIDWNPANDLQTMARVWRDGQRKPVYVYRLLTAGTIEEKMFQRQISKQSLSETVVDCCVSKTQFSYEDLKDLFTFHRDVKCITHDSIRCHCLEQEFENGDINEEIRHCQLGYLKAINQPKNTKMAEILKWKHYEGPLTNIDLPNSHLLVCEENITFLFTNKSNVPTAQPTK